MELSGISNSRRSESRRQRSRDRDYLRRYAKQQEISRQVNLKFLGSSLKVLIDEKENDHYIGRSEFDAPEVDGQVFVNSKRSLNPGDFVEVRITDTLEYDLAGAC